MSGDSINIKWSIKEDKRIRALLRRLPGDCTAKLKQTISESAEELRFIMLQRVRVKTGELAASIGMAVSSDGLTAYVGFSKTRFPRQWKLAGRRAHFTEFGTAASSGLTRGGEPKMHTSGRLKGKRHRPHARTRAFPFIFPALADAGAGIIERQKQAVADALDQASRGAGDG